MTTRIEEIKERERKATRGPWQIPLDTPYQREERGNTVGMLPPFHWHNDLMTINEVRFLDHAREDIPYLLSEVERLERDKEMLLRVAKVCDLLILHRDIIPEDINFQPLWEPMQTCRDAGLLKEGDE